MEPERVDLGGRALEPRLLGGTDDAVFDGPEKRRSRGVVGVPLLQKGRSGTGLVPVVAADGHLRLDFMDMRLASACTSNPFGYILAEGMR
jgi:hypothetical protein